MTEEIPPHPAPEPGPPARERPALPRSRAGARGEPKSRKGFWVVFLLANLIPLAAAVFWFTRPEEVRRRFLESIPPGVGSRAVAAAVALALLLVFTKAVLPGARAVVQALTRVGMGFRDLPRGKRVLAFPAEAGVDFAWLFAQILFALDVIAIFAAGAAFVLYGVKIVKPELFPFLPG